MPPDLACNNCHHAMQHVLSSNFHHKYVEAWWCSRCGAFLRREASDKPGVFRDIWELPLLNQTSQAPVAVAKSDDSENSLALLASVILQETHPPMAKPDLEALIHSVITKTFVKALQDLVERWN